MDGKEKDGAEGVLSRGEVRKEIAGSRVKEFRESLGMDQIEFAKYLGLQKHAASYVSKWEAGRSAPSDAMAALLALKSGKSAKYFQGLDHLDPLVSLGFRAAKVVGEVKFGEWKQSAFVPKHKQYDVPIMLNTPIADELMAYVVEDDSADQEFPYGTVILAVDVNKMPIEPLHEDFVIVQATNDRGLHEISLRQLIVDDVDRTTMLYFRSNRLASEKPIAFPSKEVYILGRVVSATIPFPFRRG
jgi:DNA-binding transcriptional regulator YiaG